MSSAEGRPTTARGPRVGRLPGEERERYGRSLAVAAGGLAVVIAVLLSTVLTTGMPDSSATGHGAGRDAAEARHSATQGSAHGRTYTLPGTAPGAATGDPKPEKCANGADPAASLKPSAKAGPAVRRVTERGRLVVGIDQNSYLWGYRDPASGNIEGFDIDIVQAIAEDLLGADPEVTYKTIPTNERVRAIRDGDVDMVVRTMTINCDRLDEVAFSTAYFEAGQQLVVPKDPKGRAKVTGFDSSMHGKRLCLADGSTAESLMQRGAYKALGAKVTVVDNQLDCLVRMQLGGADATLTDNALGAGQVAQDPSVELIGEPETIEPYGVAMNLKDDDLVRRVNEVLEDYRDSKWESSYEKWLGDDMMGTEDGGKPSPPKPKYRD